MSDVTAVPAALEAFGSTAAAMSATVASAGSINAAANTAVMAPVFGLIGQEFLATFVQAQAAHLFSVGQLAAVHAGTAASMLTTASDLQASDDASGAVIRAAGYGQ